jgi:amino acid transporter
VNLVWSILIVAGGCAVAVTAMLLVRRRAPDGGYFEDGDRAAGVFGVLATGFSVLLGFIVFLGFESYDQSRSGAEQEALVLVQQVENAQFFGQPARTALTGQLVCYGRSVINGEWDRMQAGTQGDALNPWGVRMFRTLQTVRPRTDTQQSAYDKWLDQTSAREEARQDRIHGAVGVIPTTLWIVLFFIAAVIFAFMLFFADRGERAVVQGMLIGSVVAVIVSLMLLLRALDEPFHGGVGGLRPVAMERSLRMIDEALGSVGAQVRLPCDALGEPLPA